MLHVHTYIRTCTIWSVVVLVVVCLLVCSEIRYCTSRDPLSARRIDAIAGLRVPTNKRLPPSSSFLWSGWEADRLPLCNCFVLRCCILFCGVAESCNVVRYR